MFNANDFNSAPTGYGRNYLPTGFDDIVTIKVIGQRLPKDSFKGDHSFYVEFAHNGVDYSWVQKIPEKDGAQKERTRAISTIKGFLSALIGPEEWETTDQAKAYDLAVSEANPFAGATIHVRTTAKATRAGGVWTNHFWTHAEAK